MIINDDDYDDDFIMMMIAMIICDDREPETPKIHYGLLAILRLESVGLPEVELTTR